MAKKIDPRKKLQEDFGRYRENRNNDSQRYNTPRRDFDPVPTKPQSAGLLDFKSRNSNRLSNNQIESIINKPVEETVPQYETPPIQKAAPDYDSGFDASRFMFNTNGSKQDKLKLENLGAQFKEINRKVGGSCTAGALNCNTDHIAPYLGTTPIRKSFEDIEKNMGKYRIPSKDYLGVDYVTNNSIDAWEIHQTMRGENIGTELFSANENTTYDGHIPKGLDLKSIPVGAIIGQGDSKGVYTSGEYGSRNRHALTVVGHDNDGMSMVYDSGKLVRLDKLASLTNSKHKITNITVPKGYEKFTHEYIKEQHEKKLKYLGLNEDVPINYNSEKKHINAIQKGVNAVKNKIAADYNISQSTINKLANYLPGLANVESKINNNEGTSVRSLMLDNWAGNKSLKGSVKLGRAVWQSYNNLFKKEGPQQSKIELEIEAYKLYGDNPEMIDNYIREKSKEQEKYKSNPNYNLKSSVGPFSIKDFPKYAEEKLGVKPYELYGMNYGNSEELEQGSKTALVFLAEKFNYYKEKNPDMTDDQLIDMSITGYNSVSHPKNEDFKKYYIKDKKLKFGYLEDVKDFNNFKYGGNLNTINNNLLNPRMFALGGNLNKNTNNMNELTQFNEGGSHESNPYGGVPIGMGENGQPNTVEQGETMQNDFVFSDRIVLRPDVISQVGLPKTLANKTIAEATKIIDKQFNGRNTKIDKSTRDAMYDRIAQAQEMIKAEEQAKIAQAQEANSTEVPDMMGGEIPQGMDQFMSPEQGMEQLPMEAQDGRVQSGMQDLGQPMFKYGGKMNKYQGGGFMNFMGSKEGSSMMGGMGTAIGGMSGGSYAKQMQKNAESGFVDNKLAKDQANEQMIEGTLDSVSSAFGPFGQAFRGIQKAGKGIGDAIGGDAGAAVSGIFSPEAATMSNLTNPDLNFGEKMAGTIPGVGGVIASRAAKKRADKEAENRERKEFYDEHIASATMNNNETQVFAYGGKVNKYPNGGFPKKLQRGQDTLDFQNWMVKNHGTSTGGQDSDPGPGTSADYTKHGGMYNIGKFAPGVEIDYTGSDNSHLNPNLSEEDILKRQISQDKSITDYQDPGYKKGEFDTSLLLPELKKNNSSGNLARYAPMLMNAFQLNTLGAPQVNRLKRLNNEYQRQFLDEATYQNMAREQASAARNAIARSGATPGQMIGAQLGTQLGATKSIADSYNQIRQHNIGENRLRQQTQFGNNQFNIQQDNLEQDINDRNKGNWQTQRSRLLGQMGTDFGNVGKEETYKDIAIKSTGYNWMGEYMDSNPNDDKEAVKKAWKKENPKGTNIQFEEIWKLRNPSSKALGGFLNKKLR